MKNDFRKKIYDHYHSVHTNNLYGELNIESLQKTFPVLQYYFGDQLPFNKDASIIDLGCGYGELVYWLNHIGYLNARGADISLEMISKGKEIGIQNTFCDDIYEVLEHNKNKYDIIFMRDILEHFNKEEVIDIIEKIYNSLHEHGKLIIQVPNGQSPFVGKIYYGDFTHRTLFTSSSINQIFRARGFSKILIQEQGPVPKNIKGRLRKYLWQFERKIFSSMQLISTGDGTGYFTQNIMAIICK